VATDGAIMKRMSDEKLPPYKLKRAASRMPSEIELKPVNE
jgi:hypothetical protein